MNILNTLSVCIFILLLVSFFFTARYMKKGHGRESETDMEMYENVPLIEIIYFYSDSCPFCTKFDPVFQKVTQKLVNSSTYQGMNISVSKMEKKDINSKEYQSLVEGYPTVLIYKNDKFLDKIVGSKDEAAFESVLGHLLK